MADQVLLPPEHVEQLAAGIITLQAIEDDEGQVSDFRCVQVNRMARQCLGPQAREWGEKPLFSHWPAFFTPQVLEHWRGLLQGEGATLTTFPNLFAPQAPALAVSAFSSGGLLTFTILSHATDLSNLGEEAGVGAEGEVIPNLVPADNAAEYLSLIINAIPNPVFIKDEQRRFVLLNDALCSFLGMSREALLGKNDYDFFPPEEADHFWRKDSEIFAGGEVSETEESVTDAGGVTKWILTRKAPCRLSNQQSLLVGIITDLSERKRIEDALRQSRSERDEAIELNQTKSLFLANMSHELRTPLNAIIGYAEMLQEDVSGFEAPQELHEDLGRIQVSARHLLALISDILDLTRIEAGQAELLAEPVVLRDLLVEVKEAIAPLTRENRSQFDVAEIPEDFVLHTDRLKLKQILLNLLGNAAKFTKGGEVRLNVTQASDEVAGYVFEVADTGVGIVADKLESIFAPFTQVDSSTTRRFGGTGMGLTIVHKLCAVLGGEVEVESEVGEGSTFRVSLPSLSSL